MLHLNYYNTLLESHKEVDSEKAELLEEEIDIVIHKLKFIAADQRPSVLLLAQKTNFAPLINEQVSDIVKIAGGNILTDETDNPDIIIVIQENDELYSTLIDALQHSNYARTKAVQENHIFIIQQSDFGTDAESFTRDVEISAEIIQPKYFIFGRQGSDWVSFDLG